MRFQVPQFVDIEDKIIGPLTLKQFLMYFAAVLSLIPAYLLFDLSLFITIALPIIGTAAAFAHFRPNGKSLAAMLGNVLKFASSGRLYLWRRDRAVKTLRIYGEDWRSVLANGEIEQPASLATMAQTLETTGNVVKMEEPVEDVMDQKAMTNDKARMMKE